MGELNLLAEEKLFYERFYALHNDPVLLAVCKRFGIRVFRRSCVLEGFADFLTKACLVGDRIIEIGTCKGLTAIVLSRFFREVVTIDIAPDFERLEIAESLGIKTVHFITVADNAEKARVINSFEFDAAFVDGDHAHDTRTDFELVKRCGRVLFHEHWAAQPPVVELVDELRSKGHVFAERKWALWKADIKATNR